jgi:hypothetical protein
MRQHGRPNRRSFYALELLVDANRKAQLSQAELSLAVGELWLGWSGLKALEGDAGGRHQPLSSFSPVMGRPAGLDPDHARRQAREELRHPRAPQPPLHEGPPVLDRHGRMRPRGEDHPAWLTRRMASAVGAAGRAQFDPEVEQEGKKE